MGKQKKTYSSSVVEKSSRSRVVNTPSNNTSKTTLSPKPFALRRTKILISILVLSFAGFLDSTYLAILGFTRTIPPCTVTHGCERVLTSQFAYVGPIPIAVIGVFYFILIMVLSLQLVQRFSSKLLKLLTLLTSAGFISGLGLIYIQAGILHAFCQYCLLAETIIALTFLLVSSIYITYSSRTRTRDQGIIQ